MSTIYKRLKLETQLSTMETQNFLHRLTENALRKGYKVTRVLSTYSDRHMRTRRIIEEVRVCGGGQI